MAPATDSSRVSSDFPDSSSHVDLLAWCMVSVALSESGGFFRRLRSVLVAVPATDLSLRSGKLLFLLLVFW